MAPSSFQTLACTALLTEKKSLLLHRPSSVVSGKGLQLIVIGHHSLEAGSHRDDSC